MKSQPTQVGFVVVADAISIAGAVWTIVFSSGAILAACFLRALIAGFLGYAGGILAP